MRKRRPRHQLEESLGSFVEWLLNRRVVGVKKKVSLATVQRESLGGKVGISVLKKLCVGDSVLPEEMMRFAKIRDVNGVDWAELIIRWGEADLGRLSYLYPNGHHARFIADFHSNRRASLLSLELKEHRPTYRSFARGDLVDGFRAYRDALGLTNGSFAPVARPTVINFLETGNISGPTLTKLLSDALFDAASSTMTEEQRECLALTRQRIFAHYIETRVERRVLDFSYADLVDCFDPSLHPRLTHWLLCSNFRLLTSNRQPIKAIDLLPQFTVLPYHDPFPIEMPD
jgi:hypothetical protein